MKNSKKLLVMLPTLLLLAMALTACGNLSKNVAADGSGAEQLVWPEAGDTNALYPDGTSPTLEALRTMHPGMSKKAVAQLIGYPQYGEGIVAVREWDYLFNLHADNGWVQCQYKVLFDEDKKAQSFYWNPASCADIVNGKKSEPTTYTLGADALFDFDSANLGSEGQSRLDELASKLNEHASDIKSVQITGYTDRLGSDSYNMRLSQERADAVRSYLASQGVPTNVMTAIGEGKNNPVKTNCTSQSRNELITCLAPNRRVEIEVTMKQ